MTSETPTIKVTWEGPYSWPGFAEENHLPSIPNIPGIYLQTFEYQNGYLIYAAGITRRSIPKRIREHTAKYLHGDYNVLDIDAARQGIRKEIWHGWVYARDHREEFEERKPMIIDAVHRQLAGFRIFVTDIGTQPRTLERLEASIMNGLYREQSPLSVVPDKGMMLAPRWESEVIIRVTNECARKLYGLATNLEA